MSLSELARALGPMARRISGMVARGIVSSSNAAGKMQTVQVRMLADEQKDDVEHFEPFGFTSRPLPGAEHVSLFFDGDRSHGVTVVVADRRYRLTNLAEGEAALHDAFGNKAHFKKDGTLDVVATAKVQITSPLVTMSGDLQVAGNITAGIKVTAPLVVGTNDVTFGGKSGIGHRHSGVQPGSGNTGTPT